MSEEVKIKSVLIKGIFSFIKNSKYNFKGAMRKGLRPIAWHTRVKGEATSCALISDFEIRKGQFNDLILTKVNKGLMTLEDTALKTFTGKVAQEKGFRTVFSITGKTNADGTYKKATVNFKK